MMKKILAFAIIAAMLLSLCACNSGGTINLTSESLTSTASTSTTIATSTLNTTSKPIETHTTVKDTTTQIDDTAIAKMMEKAVFLGDSTTNGMKYYGVLTKDKVWTPKSGTLTLSYAETANIVVFDSPNDEESEEMTIADALAKVLPEYIVITLGVNGVSFLGEENFKFFYSTLLDNIKSASPDTEIILNSIYPIAENYSDKDKINNEKITAANIWIKQLADERSLLFVDSYSILLGEDGYMVYEYTNGDGMHLCETGYRIVLENIQREMGKKYCV